MTAGTATPSAGPKPAPSPKRRRWLKRLLPLALLLPVAVWFAPAVVAKTGLRNRFARQALKDVRGSVEVGGASLGWLSPVELRDVVVTDEAGRPLARVPRITSERPLHALARNPSAPGTFTVEGPTLDVVFENGATNAESALAEFLKNDPGAPPTRTPVVVKVVGATLNLTDAATNQTATVEGIDATATVPASRADPVAVSLTARTGALSADLALGATSSAKLAAKDFPLDAVAPLVARAGPGVAVSGRASADLKATWTAGGALKAEVAGSVGAKGLRVVAPFLKGEPLKLDSLELPFDVGVAGSGLTVRAFDLTCDLGTLTAKGVFDPEEGAESVLARPGLSVSADIQLPRLLTKLRKFFHIKDDVELTAGRLELSVSSREAGGAAVWAGKVSASALRGTRGGKELAWDSPLKAEFAARYKKGQFPTFDTLTCEADFLRLNAVTGPDHLNLGASVLLDQLGARLSDFTDLGGLSLAGLAKVQFALAWKPTGEFAASAEVDLENVSALDREGKGVREPALKATAGARGTYPKVGPARLDSADLSVTAGGDALKLTLKEPVPDVRALSAGRAELALTGALATWKDRASRLLELTATLAGRLANVPVFDIAGTIAAKGEVVFAKEAVTAKGFAVTLTRPKLARWIALDEPEMRAVGDLTFTRATRVAAFTNLTIDSPTLSVKKGQLTFEFPEARDVVVSGSGPCVVDLNRVGRTVKLYADPNGDDALFGTGVGPLRFRTAGDLTTFGGTLDVTNFKYGRPGDLKWEEPKLKLEADGRYSTSGDAATLSMARVERPGLVVDAKGVLSKISATRDVDVTGTLRYDWDQLTPLARKFVGTTFTATGTGSRGFFVKGQLEPNGPAAAAPPEKGGVALKAPGAPPKTAPAGPSVLVGLDGQAALGWHALRVYGFEVGTAELNAKLSRGVVSIGRIDATFSGGTAAVTPTLDLRSDLAWLTLAKAPVIARARLTPASAASALGYALPAIANTGQAEGEISAAIDDNRICLSDLKQTNAKGVLVIHRATVGLNPVAAQVANLLGVKDTSTTLVNETSVPIEVVNGRVHHRDFAMKIGGTTVRTRGSVGFDDTLELKVELPLPKDLALLKDYPVLMKAVAGKPVTVPIGGTLSRPVLDAKAFTDAVFALAGDAAKGVGRELFEGELRKRFPNMPVPNPKGGGLPVPLPFGKKP